MVDLCRYDRSDIDVLDRQNAYCGYFRIDRYHLRFRDFSGQWSESRYFELFERGQAVAVLPYDPTNDQVVLIEQFRMGAIDSGNPWLLEIIAGIVEPGETLEDVAKRESMEEAHCQLLALEAIARVYVSPGGSSETTQLFCARVDTSIISREYAGLDEEGEDIRVYTLSYHQLVDYLISGKINSAAPIIAVQWLMLNRERIRKLWGSKV